MFVVVGATGRVGFQTVEGLIRRGHKVRALVRTVERAEPLARKRAEVVSLDLFDVEKLTAAFAGASGAFLLLPTPPPEVDFLATNDRLITVMVDAVKRAKVPSLVVLSSIGAQHPTGTGPIVSLHHAEKAFSGLAKSVTFVRAASPLELWAPLLLDALDTGKLPVFGQPHLSYAQVGAHDVGDACAQALEEHVAGTRFIEVAGTQNWSPEDVAAVLTSLLGQPIHAEARPAEGELAYLEHLGLSPSRAALMAERSKALGRGLLHFAHPHEVRRGTTSLYDAVAPLVA